MSKKPTPGVPQSPLSAADIRREVSDCTPTARTQIIRWYFGTSTHNKKSDECCPDFSCCHPELLWPVEKRALFILACDTHREIMLIESLGDLLRAQGLPIDLKVEVLAADPQVAGVPE